jgi:hypothetical protein
VTPVGSFLTSAQGGALSVDSTQALLPLTLQSTINIATPDGATVGSGRFTLKF